MTDRVLRRRGGPEDITMLIWKIINDSPNITRDEIFYKIEHQIPSGDALRRHARKRGIGEQAFEGAGADSLAPADAVQRARRYVLTDTLYTMRRSYGNLGPILEKDDYGRYSTLRELTRYQGEPEKVVVKDTIGATHLDTADAIRYVRKLKTDNIDRNRYIDIVCNMAYTRLLEEGANMEPYAIYRNDQFLGNCDSVTAQRLLENDISVPDPHHGLRLLKYIGSYICEHEIAGMDCDVCKNVEVQPAAKRIDL